MTDIQKIGFSNGKEGLAEAVQNIQGHFAFSTSFGAEDQVITHFIAEKNIDLRIFTLDTGRLFEKTYELMQRTSRKYKLYIETYFPDAEDIKKYVQKKGINGFYDSIENRKQCCHIRKVIPLNKALDGVEYWVSGLRREQSDFRNDLESVMWDEKMGLWKIYPILEWSWSDVMNYLDENNVPYNPMHKNGYPSIGCEPCTRAIQPGEDFRAGRWSWESSKKECGLHS